MGRRVSPEHKSVGHPEGVVPPARRSPEGDVRRSHWRSTAVARQTQCSSALWSCPRADRANDEAVEGLLATVMDAVSSGTRPLRRGTVFVSLRMVSGCLGCVKHRAKRLRRKFLRMLCELRYGEGAWECGLRIGFPLQSCQRILAHRCCSHTNSRVAVSASSNGINELFGNGVCLPIP